MAGKIYKGSQLIKKVYKGGQEVKKIYKGATLIWQADPYEPGTIVYQQATPGTYNVSLAEGVYEITVVGAGGGGASNNCTSGSARDCNNVGPGGSGAAWRGQIKLSAGNYSVTVGKGGNGQAIGNSPKSHSQGGSGTQSTFNNLIICGGGGGGWASYSTANSSSGAGGSAPVVSVTAISVSINAAGNVGQRQSSYAGGTWTSPNVASPEGVHGYGGGGSSCYNPNQVSAENGGNGYVSIKYITMD